MICCIEGRERVGCGLGDEGSCDLCAHGMHKNLEGEWDTPFAPTRLAYVVHEEHGCTAVTALLENLRFSRRSICVSTVGPSPSAIRRAAEALPVKLAWSVHAADDTLRRALVPQAPQPTPFGQD